MKYFFTLLLFTSLISLASTLQADEDENYIEIEIDYFTEEDSKMALEEDFMADVMSNYVLSDVNVALFADGEEHSINKRASTWESKTRPEMHFLYYIAIVIVVVLIVVGLIVWMCWPCNCKL